MPDDFIANFRRGFKAHAIEYSADPKVRATFPQAKSDWLASIAGAEMQGDRDTDSFMAIPATQVVSDIYSRRRNPNDPGRPY
jgi:hypothetical protein